MTVTMTHREDLRAVRPTWMKDWGQHGACSKAAPDALFVRGAAQQAAKQVCVGCPVITECLDHALRVRESYGVWGGHTEDERARLLGGPVPALSSADPHYRTPRRVPPPRPSRNQ